MNSESTTSSKLVRRRTTSRHDAWRHKRKVTGETRATAQRRRSPRVLEPSVEALQARTDRDDDERQGKHAVRDNETSVLQVG